MPPEEIDPGYVEALHKRIIALEERVEELESGEVGRPQQQADSRDQTILNQLERGEVVSATTLKELFRTHTDIRSGRTLTNRVRALTKRPYFEQVGHARWQYVGGDDE